MNAIDEALESDALDRIGDACNETIRGIFGDGSGFVLIVCAPVDEGTKLRLCTNLHPVDAASALAMLARDYADRHGVTPKEWTATEQT